MLRRLGGCAVALALLLPTQALAAPPSAQPEQRATATTTKAREVRLGHEPVRATTADKVRLTFEGRKGQLVNLARVAATEQCGGRVLRRGGTVVKPWAQGYWRLPRTATYTAINKPCHGEKQRIRLQVRKVVRQERAVPGKPSRAGRSAKVTHLVPFRVGAQQVAHVNAGAFDLIRPDRTITHVPADEREAFYLVRDYDGPFRYDRPSPVGRYFAEVPPRTTVSLHVQQLNHAVVDGPAVTVVQSPSDSSSTQLLFTGEAGQWIYPEVTTGSDDPAAARQWLTQVRDAFGEFPARVGAACPGGDQQSFCPIVRLPASGTFVLDVLSGPGSATAQVRVRSAAQAAPATVDGDTVTYTVRTPGQWVVGELPELPQDASGGSGATVTLSNAAGPLGDWRLSTVSGYGRCNPSVDMVKCFAIDEPPNAFTMSPTSLTSPAPWDAFEHTSVAILAVPPGATGSLDLAVTRSAP